MQIVGVTCFLFSKNHFLLIFPTNGLRSGRIYILTHIAMRIILGILISAIAIVLAAYIVPGVQVDSFWTAVIVAIVLAVVNGVLGSLLRLLTLPVNILTLGLASFIITVLMIMLVSSMVDGFNTG